MRKLLFTLGLCLLGTLQLKAQRTIYGTVTSNQGESLIGASVFPANAPSLGTVTDISGRFELTVPDTSRAFIISYVGFIDREIPLNKGNMYNIGLEEGVQLSEVVVTALGIPREKKSLGYSAQEIKGEDLSLTRETNIASSLSGKIAGVQVVSTSGASMGGSALIRLRGSNGLEGGSPLFIVDGTPISNDNFSEQYSGPDFGNLAQDINPDDIESITVLKGPSATALYGNRAANGVIMISTKKGTKQEGLGVSVNSSITIERVGILPEYQNEYAGGYDGTFPTYTDPVDGQTYNGLEYYADESWGPKIDGTTQYRPWWSWFSGEDYGKQIPLTANPNNVRDFFDTGVKYQNNFAISGGNKQSTFRLSYTNVNHRGVIPNSTLQEHNVAINASLNLTEQLTLSTSLNLANNSGKGRPQFGGGTNNPVGSFNRWFQRQLDIDQLRNYTNPDGTYRSWNIRGPHDKRPLFWDSPFFAVHENFSTDGRDRYFGNVSLKYQINEHFQLTMAARRDKYNQRIERRIATGGRDLDQYSEFVADGQEDNYDFLLKYNNRFKNITLDAHAGGAYRVNKFHSNFAQTVGGLNAPDLFNLSASIDRPRLTSFISEKRVGSLYGSLSLGYKNFLYLGGTLRNDWSSALPAANNSYLYPSVNASFVFTELWKPKWLSYGKLRASFAKVGSDPNPYQTNVIFDTGTPFGAKPAFEIPNTLLNENLRPALSASYEIGIETRMVDNRLGLDLTYYREDNKDQILTLDVPGSSGYRSAVVNAGNIRDEGLELSLNVSLFRKKQFSWNLTFNMAKNESTVIELADGIENRILEGGGQWSLNAPVGGEWGMQRGVAFQRINGQPVLNEDGSYATVRDQELGGLLPDYTGGVMNRFQLFGLEIGAFIDFQIGGVLWSGTKLFNGYSGLAPETAGLNDKGNPVRAPISEGGGYKVEGVLESGEPYATYVNPETHFKSLVNIDEAWNYDASFIKLRELSIGYNFPEKWVKQLPFNQLSVSLIARNVWLIHAKVDGLDPSELSPGSNPFVSGEVALLPPVRSIGLNLKAAF